MSTNVPVPAVPYNPFAQYQLPSGVRKFTNSRLQDAIDDAIASAGDAHFVVVGHHEYNQTGGINENVTKLSALVRTSDGKYTLSLGAFKDWNKGDQGVEAKVVWKPF